MGLQRSEFIWFDLGNVLMHFSRERQGRALLALPGCQRALEEIIPFIDGHSQEHLAYETGHLSRDAFLSRLAAFLGTSATLEQVEEAYATLFTRNDPVCSLLARVAELMPVGLATNSDPSHLAKVRKDDHDVIDLFGDRIVASFLCGHRKPSSDFFDCMVKLSAIPPHLLCFIDDLEANIAGAQAAGIKTIHFRGEVEQLASALSAYGVRGTE